MPRLLIPISVGLPPVEYCRGTRPSHAAEIASLLELTPLADCCYAVPLAVKGPIPGIVIRRRATSSRSTSASISRVISAIRPSNCLSSSKRPVNKRRIGTDRSFAFIRDDARQVEFEHASALPDCNTILKAEGAHLADQLCSVGSQSGCGSGAAPEDRPARQSSPQRSYRRFTASAIAAASIVSFLFDST